MRVMLPEILIAISIAVCILQSAFREKAKASQAALPALAAQLAALVALLSGPVSGVALGGSFVIHSMAFWFKLIFLGSALLLTLLSMDRPVEKREGLVGGEFYAVFQSSLLGMLFLASAGDLLTLFISLELATLPIVALSAWNRRSSKSSEAGLKFVLLAALSSALLVFGMSILTGLKGDLWITLDASLLELPLSALGVSLMLVGAGFKMSLVPFHLWAADVYEGAPTPVTAWLATASKAAGLAFLLQILLGPGFDYLPRILPLLALLAALTMTLGNLVATVQQNIKRFMAYSSISQAGYLLMGLLMGANGAGLGAILYYTMVYLLANIAVFAIILERERDTGASEIEDFRGLIRTRPAMATAMLLALLSLAGIPPLAGFTGKWFLFNTAAESGYYWLVIVAAINSTVSLYYYLRIVRQMFIEVEGDTPPAGESGQLASFVISFCTVAICLAGIVPSLYEWIRTTSVGFLAGL